MKNYNYNVVLNETNKNNADALPVDYAVGSAAGECETMCC